MAKLSNSELEPFAYNGAIKWCGEKERETFPEDIAYFLNNWRYFPGLRAHVIDAHRAATTSDASQADSNSGDAS